MTPEQRSYCMSQIKSKGTKPERIAEALLREVAKEHGLALTLHPKGLPGNPDMVFAELRVAVFVDGDFWHGRHFHRWGRKLTQEWHTKIAGNRARDRRTRAALRRLGWRTVRLWEGDLKTKPEACLLRVVALCS